MIKDHVWNQKKTKKIWRNRFILPISVHRLSSLFCLLQRRRMKWIKRMRIRTGQKKDGEDWDWPSIAMRVFVAPEVWPGLQLTLPQEREELGDLLQGGRGGRKEEERERENGYTSSETSYTHWDFLRFQGTTSGWLLDQKLLWFALDKSNIYGVYTRTEVVWGFLLWILLLFYDKVEFEERVCTLMPVNYLDKNPYDIYVQ